MTRQNIFFPLAFILFCICGIANVYADGIILGGTRVIYNSHQKQTSISIRNASGNMRYMVQTWVEDSDGNKSQDFIVTPPIYVSNPKDDNTLRIMYTGKPISSRQEQLYFLNVKAIPAIDKNDTEGKNMLLLSTVTRIKIFLRPESIDSNSEDAPLKLQFIRNGKNLIIKNPSPYHITMVNTKADSKELGSMMIPPGGALTVEDFNKTLSYKVINDFGGLSEEIKRDL